MFKKSEVVWLAAMMWGLGWWAKVASTIFYQDALGLEKYIEYCRIGWVDLSPWWGGILFFALIVESARRFRKILERPDNDYVYYKE